MARPLAIRWLERMLGLRSKATDLASEEARGLLRMEDLYPFTDLRNVLSKQIDVVAHAKQKAAEGVGQTIARSQVEDSLCVLYGSCYEGLVCDFDGTLVPLGCEKGMLDDDLLRAVVRLLRGRIHMAVITGRGRSILASLRKQIPADVVGMISCYLHNGGVLWNLADAQPCWIVRLLETKEVLAKLREIARRDDAIVGVESSSMGCQVTAHLNGPVHSLRIVNHLEELALEEGWAVEVRTSGRSVDIFPKNVSKRKAMLDFRIRNLHQSARLLVIGDQGAPGGNDFELLQSPYSLSVDRFSWQPACCFPVVDRQGQVLTGPLATAAVLGPVEIRGKGFSLVV